MRHARQPFAHGLDQRSTLRLDCRGKYEHVTDPEQVTNLSEGHGSYGVTGLPEQLMCERPQAACLLLRFSDK